MTSAGAAGLLDEYQPPDRGLRHSYPRRASGTDTELDGTAPGRDARAARRLRSPRSIAWPISLEDRRRSSRRRTRARRPRRAPSARGSGRTRRGPGRPRSDHHSRSTRPAATGRGSACSSASGAASASGVGRSTEIRSSPPSPTARRSTPSVAARLWISRHVGGRQDDDRSTTGRPRLRPRAAARRSSIIAASAGGRSSPARRAGPALLLGPHLGLDLGELAVGLLDRARPVAARRDASLELLGASRAASRPGPARAPRYAASASSRIRNRPLSRSIGSRRSVPIESNSTGDAGPPAALARRSPQRRHEPEVVEDHRADVEDERLRRFERLLDHRDELADLAARPSPGRGATSRSTIWAWSTMLVRLWAGPSCIARAISRRRSSWAPSSEPRDGRRHRRVRGQAAAPAAAASAARRRAPAAIDGAPSVVDIARRARRGSGQRPALALEDVDLATPSAAARLVSVTSWALRSRSRRRSGSPSAAERVGELLGRRRPAASRGGRPRSAPGRRAGRSRRARVERAPARRHPRGELGRRRARRARRRLGLGRCHGRSISPPASGSSPGASRRRRPGSGR